MLTSILFETLELKDNLVVLFVLPYNAYDFNKSDTAQYMVKEKVGWNSGNPSHIHIPAASSTNSICFIALVHVKKKGEHLV